MLSIILSRRDFRENDQIISIYTAEKGKLEVLARGVKKIISKNSAFLEPFFLVDAEVVCGKEIMHLTKVQPINSFKNIRSDLDKIFMAGYLINLTDRLLKAEDPDKRVYKLLLSFLEFFDQTSVNNSLILDSYLLKFFSLLGFDISGVETIDMNTKKYLELLLNNEWNNLPTDLDKKVVQSLHRTVHQFIQAQSEQKLAYFSQI